MFTGIIEALGVIEEVRPKGSNLSFRVSSPLAPELSNDQSLAHDGVCLTVESTAEGSHWVTAVRETLGKTTLGNWGVGQSVNLERSLSLNSRLDGHIVQGHVDTTGTCREKKVLEGSWEFGFSFPREHAALVIEKGSISLNGISLTVFNVTLDSFSVAIIPYTYEHTNLNQLVPGMNVNLEFDLLGKYVLRNLTAGKQY
jgi:riboflavin synthase